MVSKKYQAGVNLVLKNWYQGRNCIRFGRSGDGISGYSIKMVSISLFFGIGKKLSQKKFQNGDVMRDKELLTLTEISKKLNVNYKTLLSCKSRYSDYVFGFPVGREVKYHPDYADFFKMVFALQDEGYSTEKIRDLLKFGVVSEEDKFISEWLESWRNVLVKDSGMFSFRLPIIWSNDQVDDKMTDRLTDRRTY